MRIVESSCSCSDDESDDGWDSVDDSEEESNRPPPFDLTVKFPPEWERIEKSPQYLFGLIHRFVEPWDLETEPPIPDSDFQYPPFYRGPKIENVHHKLKRRIQSIRDSRGYDVERGIPSFFLGDPFTTVDMEGPFFKEDKEDYDQIMEFLLREINSHAQAQRHGKKYELVAIEKIVAALRHRVNLITFRVKEFSDAAENMDVEKKTIQAMVYAELNCSLFRLCEWRFKPQAT